MRDAYADGVPHNRTKKHILGYWVVRGIERLMVEVEIEIEGWMERGEVRRCRINFFRYTLAQAHNASNHNALKHPRIVGDIQGFAWMI
jgi:hypothetical protein